MSQPDSSRNQDCSLRSDSFLKGSLMFKGTGFIKASVMFRVEGIGVRV